MRSRRASTIVVALTLGLLVFSLGALSALALTRSSGAAPNCGAPSVDTIPCIESGHHDDVVQLNGPTRIGGLKVKAGNWFFVSKVVLTSSLSGPHSILCTLTAGISVDSAEVVLPPNQSDTGTLTLVQTFDSPGTAIVSCTGISGESASLLKITGIRAGTLFNQEIS